MLTTVIAVAIQAFVLRHYARVNLGTLPAIVVLAVTVLVTL